jgi:hypothetical protein
MTTLTRRPKREKNKWLRELEESDREQREKQLEYQDNWDRFDEPTEEDLWGDWYDDTWDDDWRIEDEYDDWRGSDEYDPYDWDDRFDDDEGAYYHSNYPMFLAGSHVKSKNRLYLVLSDERYADMLTGQIVSWLFKPELVWRG